MYYANKNVFVKSIETQMSCRQIQSVSVNIDIRLIFRLFFGLLRLAVSLLLFHFLFMNPHYQRSVEYSPINAYLW